MSSSHPGVTGTSLSDDVSILAQLADRPQDGLDTADSSSDSHGGRQPMRGLSPSDHTPLLSDQKNYQSKTPASSVPRYTDDPAIEFDPLLDAILRQPDSLGTTNARSDEPTDRSTLWWEEARVISHYTAPIFGTHVLEYSLSVVSVVSIGHISTIHLAAVTLGTMTSTVTGLSIILGFVSALDSLLPQAWTSSAPHLVGLWSQRMAILQTLLLIPIFVIWFTAEPVLLFLRQEPQVAYLAGLYLRWFSIGLPAYAFNAIVRRYLQSQGLMHIPTLIVILVAPINCFLNWLLVWGPEPIRLGYIGAPIATAVSFNLISVCNLIYAVKYSPPEAWHPFSMSAFSNLGLIFQLGIAGVGQLAAEWWSFELVGLAASQLGPVALAAQSVLLVSASVSYQAPYALGAAASVRIGHNLGLRSPRRAKVATEASLTGCLFMMLGLGAIFIIFRKNWGYIFNDDPEVIQLVASVLPLVGLFQILDGNSCVNAGVFRARGQQHISAFLNFISYYIIGIPIGLLLTFKFDLGLGLFGLWIGLAIALLFNASLSTFLVLRTDWDLEVARVADRLARDRDGERSVKPAEQALPAGDRSV